MPLERVGRYQVTAKPRPDRGTVRYPAIDTLLGREVVIRAIPASLQGDAQVREHFLSLSRHLARLRHPNIAALLDIVEQDGRIFQVLPREVGVSLASLLRRAPPAEPDWALGIAAGLCDGLSYVHAEGVVHTRLRADVVFLTDGENPVLHGFEPEPPAFADPLLKVGTVVENARFVAPEVLRREAPDGRADLWSLGILLHYLVTHRYPQCGRDALAVMEETTDARPFQPVTRLRADLPARVCDLIMRLLEKDRARRPHSADVVRSELDDLLAAATDDAGPAGLRTVRLLGAGAGGLRRYAIEEKVGSGAFGVVFRARERATGTAVAVKILRPDLVEDDRAAARFRREAEAARAIEHPGVVRVLDSGRDGDAHYVVMEYVDGPSLAAYLHRATRLPWREAATIAAGVLDALARAHACEVVHRDLKPANILLRGGSAPVILDFGMSHLASATRLTQSGEVLGSPTYMAPEQLAGKPADPRADLYAVGVILYELLCGAPPFEADNLPALCRRILEEPPRPLRERVADLPAALDALVARLLAKDPCARGGGAASIAAELRNLP